MDNIFLEHRLTIFFFSIETLMGEARRVVTEKDEFESRVELKLYAQFGNCHLEP